MPVHLEKDLSGAAIGPGAAGDFWRSGAGAVFPDGVSDTTEGISRYGKVAIWATGGTLQDPTAQLDITIAANRTGVSLVNAGDPIYATGNIAGSSNAVNCLTLDATTPKFYFGHSNQTQGFAIGYDTIAHLGVGDFYLQLNGNGQFSRKWPLPLAGNNAHINESICGALTNLQGFYNRGFVNGAQVRGNLFRFNTGLPGGALGYENFVQMTRPDGAFVNYHRYAWNFKQLNTSAFSVNPNNHLSDRLVTFYGDPGGGPGACYSMGIRPNEFASFIPVGADFWRWRRDVDDAVQFSVSGVGNVTVDPSGVGPGGWASPVLRFGGEGSDEGIRSQRIGADRFLEDIEIYTQSGRRFAVLNNGRIYMAVVPTFATDALAGAGGLATGEVYKDVFGALRIKL